jgi:tape measure domain-containing protein
MATMQLKTNEQNFVNGLKKASGSVGELAGVMNVKLANSFKSADFYSKNFEKGIGRLSSAFKEAGQGMTLGLTLPLAFLGKSASDAYGEFDALRRALGTMETTSVGLSNRLKELREVAKMPGIGFQEAIQGDVRLRSVGISAALSARILREFANAVAMTGGGKAQLNEITVQLGQMAAKGKVLAQDLRPIIEAAPAVSTALKNMFGTVSSEAISEQLEKTGKSSTDMITMLLTEMEKAPRVTGGWKNSLENLGDTLFVAKAEIFEVADKVFDLGGKLASVSSSVENFVDGFKNLPEPVQKVILGMTALVAILGPATYGLGLLANGISLAVTAAGLATLGIGALVAVVGTLAFAMFSSIAATEKFNKTTQDLTKTKEEAVRETDKETRKIQDLISVIQKGATKTTEFKNAKQELLRINPEYKAALSGEIVDYVKLNDVTSKTVTNLIRVAEKKKLIAQQDAAIAALTELRSGGGITAEESLTAFLSSDITEIYEKRVKKFGGLLDYEKDLVYNKAYKLSSTLQDITAELNKNYGGLAEGMSGGGSPEIKLLSGSEDKKGDAKKAMDKHIKEVEDFAIKRRKALDKINSEALDRRLEESKSIEYDLDLSNLPKAPEPRIDRANDINWMMTFGFNAPLLKGLSEDEVKGWEDINKAQNKGLSRYQQNLKDWPKNMEFVREDLQNMSIDLMTDMVSGFVSGEGMQGALKGALNAFGSYAIQLGKSILPLAKVLEMLKINPTPANAIALIAGGALVKGLASRIDVPKFAEGGAVNNPTLAMIGDNASGKEMVLPFEKTGQFANMIAQQMGGGGGNFSVATKISGNDLLILVERAKKTK